VTRWSSIVDCVLLL